MVKNVNMNFSRNFDIFAIKMTYLNALLSFLLSSCFSARSLLSELSPCPSPDVPSETVRVVLPFKDQPSANYVKQQLNNLSSKLNVTKS